MKNLYLVFQFLLLITFSHASDTTTVLKYVVRQPKVPTQNPELIILLHGFGGNEKNLFQLADQLPAEALIVSARGPITVSEGSYAWVYVNLSTGNRVIDPADVDQVRNLLIRFIGELKSIFTFDTTKVFLCGFSQGAIMSYSVGLTRPDLVYGIGIFSGRLFDPVKPLIVLNDKLKGLKIFVSHGKKDDIIPISSARNSVLYLKKTLHLSPKYKEYEAGHEITPAMLKDFVKWLYKVQ